MQRINLKLIEELPYAAGNNLPAVQSKKSVPPRLGLSPALSHILQEIRRELESLGIEQSAEAALRSEDLVRLIQQTAARIGFELSAYEQDEILAQLEREQKPFGVLQPLVDDPEVSDIIVSDYSHVTVQQGRRNYTTNLSFPDQTSYENFVERLLLKAGSSYSTKKPIADGMIGSYARVHAVHRCLCESGPYLTIRLNRFSSVTVNDLRTNGTAPQVIFDYLTSVIAAGNTVLVVGEVGTGKTTLIRALASSISHDESILVIEDTPEIRLDHPQTRYVTTRSTNADGAGRVSPSDCIRAGMRMAMNRIIFGEMRDAEAAEAFIDVCASGHPGLSTIHAKSASEAVVRLELFLGRAQKGVERHVLSDQIATAVQVIVFVNICKSTGKRRIIQVKEIGPVADGVLRQRDLFQYQLKSGVPTWRTLTRVSAHREWLEKQNINLSAFPAEIELSVSSQLAEAVDRKLG